MPQARFKRADRTQIEMRMASPDQLVPRDHRVWAVRVYVEALNLGPLYAKVRAVEGHVGRHPVEPLLHFSLNGLSQRASSRRLSVRTSPASEADRHSDGDCEVPFIRLVMVACPFRGRSETCDEIRFITQHAAFFNTW